MSIDRSENAGGARASLCESLRANADLTDKAVEFMSDPEQIEEAKADIQLWRAAADEIESLQRVVDGYSNALADRGLL